MITDHGKHVTGAGLPSNQYIPCLRILYIVHAKQFLVVLSICLSDESRNVRLPSVVVIVAAGATIKLPMQEFGVDSFLSQCFRTFSHLDYLTHVRLYDGSIRAVRMRTNCDQLEALRSKRNILTVAWKSRNALACRVRRLISLELGAQLMRTSGKDLRPSE